MTTGPAPAPIATLLFSNRWVENALPRVIWARLATPEEIEQAEAMLRRLKLPPDAMVGAAPGKRHWVTIMANAPAKVRAAVAALGSMLANTSAIEKENNYVH